MPIVNIIPTDDGIKIFIPVRSNLYLRIFFSIWLSIWCIGLYRAIKGLLKSNLDIYNFIFFIIPITIMLMIVVISLKKLIWSIFGSEEIIANSDYIKIVTRILNYKYSRKYNIDLIHDLMINDKYLIEKKNIDKIDYDMLSAMRIGSVKFSYGKKKVSIASGIEREDAKIIINRIKSIIGE